MANSVAVPPHAQPHPTSTGKTAPVRSLWLDLTRRCQLACPACYNDSGVHGTHGSMTCQDWTTVLDHAAHAGVELVQLIGGEPMLHPDAPALAVHARNLGMAVEVYSNLVHVTPEWWDVLTRYGVSVATSYYSTDPATHNAMTGRPSHRATRANIEKAAALGIPVRVGVVAGEQNRDHVDAARRELEALGVTRIDVDHVRPFGRAASGQEPDPSRLCGQCGNGKAAISLDGHVSPCVFSTWMRVGNVHDHDLAAILTSATMAEATRIIREAPHTNDGCDPDHDCTPGFPGSGCSPRK